MTTNPSKCFARMTLACVLAVGSCAALASDEERPSIRVSYADLNLDTPSGLESLRNRIAHAAYRVCSDLQMTGLRATQRFRKCVSTATNDAFALGRWPTG